MMADPTPEVQPEETDLAAAQAKAQEEATALRANADAAQVASDSNPADKGLATIAADAKKLAEDAETALADAVQAVIDAKEPVVDLSVTHTFTAIRNFTAYFEHQLLTFVKDEIIDGRVAQWLRDRGAPIAAAEKAPEKPKGK